MTARTLLVRGMLVGVAAGLLAFAFGRLFGEGPIDAAIAFESAHAGTHDHGTEPVSRAVQASLGLGVAAVGYGAAVGGMFALVFAVTYRRFSRAGARALAASLAGAGFVTLVVVPFLKYPANPPGVGSEDTVGQRTALYLLMIFISVAAAVAAALLRRSWLARWGAWNATLLAMGAFVVIVGAAIGLLPGIDEVPPDFPATVLWEFRVASVGMQLVLWATLGLLFGALTERAERVKPGALQASNVDS
jgi:hypothetical protein